MGADMRIADDDRFSPHALVVIAQDERDCIHQHERLMAKCFDNVVLVDHIRKGAHVVHEEECFGCDHKVYTGRHTCEHEMADWTVA